MVLVVARLEPGEVSSPDVPARHEGEECVLVLAGRIEIDMDGTLIELDEGDCLYFDAKVPHKMRNIHDGPSEVLAALAGN
jgi:mannose-6-phosphate isomerase-like protein (cupin superfamily)